MQSETAGGMIRGVLRLVVAVGVSALVAPLALAALAVGALSRQIGRRATGWIMHVWARLLCATFGIRVRVDGERPPRPAFVAPNHVGYVDILVLGALCDGFFVSRADVRDWPVLGPLARLGGTIFLERERRRDTHRATSAAEDVLAQGARLVVFLEGRAGPGDVLRPFRSSLLEAAVRTGVPCVPVAVRYTLPRNPELDPRDVVAWHDATPFPAHAWRLACVRRVVAEVRVLPPRTSDGREALTRKDLAAELERDVRAVIEVRRDPDPVSADQLSEDRSPGSSAAPR